MKTSSFLAAVYPKSGRCATVEFFATVSMQSKVHRSSPRLLRYCCILCLALATQIAVGATSGNDAPESDDESVTFRLPGTEHSATSSDSRLELDDVIVAGASQSSRFSWWPKQLVVVPVPGYSPQLGWSLTLGGAWYLDEESDGGPPPSVIGAFAFGSENGSTAYGAGGMFHLKDDRFRVSAGLGHLDVEYRFYGIGNEVNSQGLALDIQQTAPAAFATLTGRVWKKLYLGAGFLWSDVETRPKLTLVDDVIPDFDPVIELEMAALMIPIEWDSRDHNVFPRDGWHIKSNVILYREEVGSDFDATTISLGVNRYIPVRDDDVFALRAYLRSASGDAPFFLLSSFGGSTDLRGYPSGRYRDRMMYAVQGEYRWQFHRRWIATGFAGVGEVADDWNGFGKNYLPAGGLGLRFVVSEEHRVSLSADIAAGEDGYEFYFGVNEAF